MNARDAFGTAPDSFKARIASTLETIEEEKTMKRISLRVALCAAAVLLLLAGVVYAAANDWKLFDFYKQRYGMELSGEAQTALKQSEVNQTVEVGDLVFTVREAIADGRYLYITGTARHKTPDTAYLMDMMTGPADWMVVNGDYSPENKRSYKTAAIEDGRRLYSVEMNATAIGHEDVGGMGDAVMAADGSVSIMMGSEIATDDETLQVSIRCFSTEWVRDGDTFAPGERSEKTVDLTVPVTQGDKRTIEVDKMMPGTAAQIDRIELSLTPLACYYAIHYTIVENEDKLLTAHSRHVLWMEFADMTGAILPIGASLGGTIESDDDAHYVASGSVTLGAYPDKLILRPGDGWGGGPDDLLVLDIPAK